MVIKASNQVIKVINQTNANADRGGRGSSQKGFNGAADWCLAFLKPGHLVLSWTPNR